MANKTELKGDQEILHLFYQYSLNGLQDPIATDDDLKAKMQGDLREFIKAGVSTRTELYLLECFGSAGYALSYIRSGQDRGDFSILRAWIPTIFQYDAKNLVSFLKDKLDTLDRLAYDHTAELPGAIKKCAEEFQPSDNDRTTCRLFSQIETEPRGSNAPYAWCWLKEKSIEEVITHYIPQSNFGQYRGVFFVNTQSAPLEFSPGLAVIKEGDLKPIITIPTLSPKLTPDVKEFGIKPEDFNLSRLIIDSTTINLSDKGAKQFECWAGAEVEASWQFKSEAFDPIVKRAKVQSAQDLEKLTLIQAGDVRRRFSQEEFRIVDKTTNYDQTKNFKPQLIKRGLLQDGDIFSKEFSLVDFKDGPLSISFKAYSTMRFKPDSFDLKINIDHFLNPSTITTPVVEVRRSKIRFDVEVCAHAKDYSSDTQVLNELTTKIKSLSTNSFDIKVTFSSIIYPTSSTARVASSTPQRPQTSGSWSDFPTSNAPKVAPDYPLRPQTSGSWSDNFPTSNAPKVAPDYPLRPQVSEVDPSSTYDQRERPKEKKRGVMKWVYRVSYICASLFVVGLVLAFTRVISIQWGAKSREAKEEQFAPVDSIITDDKTFTVDSITTTVDSLQNDLQNFTIELSNVDVLVKDSSDSVQQKERLAKIETLQACTSRLENQLGSLNRKLRLIKEDKEMTSALQSYSDSLSMYQDSLRTLLDDLDGILSRVNRKDSSRLTDALQKILDSLSSLLDDLDQLSTESSVTSAIQQAEREEVGKKTPDWVKWGGIALAVVVVIVLAVVISLRKKDNRTDSVDTPSSDKDADKRSDKDAGKRSNKDAGKLSNKEADKRSDKEADKRSSKGAGKPSDKDAGKRSNKASNGNNPKQRDSTSQKQTK